MLRVGLTGGLGSGKSTVADYLRMLGAEVIEADELGRILMEPGHTVYAEIVRTFGSEVVLPDGQLNRTRLAELAFQGKQLDTLNAIVHPAVIAAQQRWMKEVFALHPAAVAVVESALIFEVERDARARGVEEGILANWRRQFDRIVVVTAPDEVKIVRYAARVSSGSNDLKAAAADGRNRLAHQISDAEKAARADYIVNNKGDKSALRAQVEGLWQHLKAESNSILPGESLE
jgi:dephospho-CoA kinase